MSISKDIYNCLLEYVKHNVCSICSLHVPCNENYCKNTQITPVINFDAVKDEWCTYNGVPSDSSVDAVTCNNKLCFIELKGWKKFLEYQKILKKNSLTERDIDVLKNKIKRKAGNYDFQKKLIESIAICENISGIDDIMGKVPLTFIVVTDISTKDNPLEMFTQQLLMLANTSSDWEKVCRDEMMKQLKRQILSVDTYFNVSSTNSEQSKLCVNCS